MNTKYLYFYSISLLDKTERSSGLYLSSKRAGIDIGYKEFVDGLCKEAGCRSSKKYCFDNTFMESLSFLHEADGDGAEGDL